jgi:hypothetical protein
MFKGCDKVLVILTVIASALWWWPIIMDPNLGFRWWLPLVLAGLWVVLATALYKERLLHFALGTTFGTLVGLVVGYAIWWPTDSIAGSFLFYKIFAATLATVLVSALGGLAGLQLSASDVNLRGAIWFGLGCFAAFGPGAIALTPPLVERRMARDDQAAADRFASLKSAAKQTMTESGDPKRICDGLSLKQNYSGPPFSQQDWGRITGNYVKEDGYVFMVYCRERGGYTIHAMPAREKGDGTRQFCSDESGNTSCGIAWNRTRRVCTDCAK